MGAARWISSVAGLSVALAFPPGCIVSDMRYVDPLAGETPITVNDGWPSCMSACSSDSRCKGFTYYTISKECYFSTSGLSSKLHRQVDEPSCYSGPPACASTSPACSFGINGPWPRATAAESDSAFSNGYQPSSLQCWPREGGNYLGCSEVSTLDDTETGWPGKCLGLHSTSLSTDETCEEKCLADVNCPGFQVGSDGSCWLGLGEGCYDQPSWNYSWTPTSAKRFQRGTVEVKMSLVGMQVIGLRQVFDKANADKMPDASLQCKKTCYSSLHCQFWQLHNETGCWIEKPSHPVQYPLTSFQVLNNSAFAPNFIAGEYIQHLCTTPETTTTTATTTTTEGAGGFPWWGWLLLALLLCCCIAALAAFLLCGQKKSKKPKKSRKTLKQQPAQSAPLMQAQPVPAQVTAMPVYTTPAPVYTAVPAPVAQSRAVPMLMAPQQPAVAVQQPAMLAPQPVSQFDMMDRNHDGVITRQEFQQMMGGR